MPVDLQAEIDTSVGSICQLARWAASFPPDPDLERRFHPYMSPYYEFMKSLTEWFGKCFCVELGVEKGRGVISLASGSDGACVLGIDRIRYLTWPDIEAEFPKVRLESRTSLPALPELLQCPIDILHIDTMHTYDTAKSEFEAYEPYLADFAVVLFDDLHAENDAVLRYFYSLPYWKIQADELHPVCGYGILIYERKS